MRTGPGDCSCFVGFTQLLSFVALCRRTHRVSDGRAVQDLRGGKKYPRIHPLSDGAQETEAHRRSQEHLCVQTVHTKLKGAWTHQTLSD